MSQIKPSKLIRRQAVAEAIDSRLKQLDATAESIATTAGLDATLFSHARHGRRSLTETQLVRVARALKGPSDTDDEAIFGFLSDVFEVSPIIDSTRQDALEEILSSAANGRRGTITAGVVDYPPFSDWNKGNPKGFAIELFDLVAKQYMDLDINWVQLNWSNFRGSLESGSVHIVVSYIYRSFSRLLTLETIEFIPNLAFGINAIVPSGAKIRLRDSNLNLEPGHSFIDDLQTLSLMDYPVYVLGGEVGDEYISNAFDPPLSRIKRLSSLDFDELFERALKENAVAVSEEMACKRFVDEHINECSLLYETSIYRMRGGLCCARSSPALISLLYEAFELLWESHVPRARSIVQRYRAGIETHSTTNKTEQGEVNEFNEWFARTFDPYGLPRPQGKPNSKTAPRKDH